MTSGDYRCRGPAYGEGERAKLCFFWYVYDEMRPEASLLSGGLHMIFHDTPAIKQAAIREVPHGKRQRATAQQTQLGASTQGGSLEGWREIFVTST